MATKQESSSAKKPTPKKSAKKRNPAAKKPAKPQNKKAPEKASATPKTAKVVETADVAEELEYAKESDPDMIQITSDMPEGQKRVLQALAKKRATAAAELARRKEMPPEMRQQRYVPGQSGNPSGRPKQQDQMVKFCREFLEDAAFLFVSTMLDETAPLRERVKCAENVMDRAIGKPKQEIDGNIDNVIHIVIGQELRELSK